MLLLTISELMRLTRLELCDLAARIINHWPDFPEGSDEEFVARTNLANIRLLLALRRHAPD